MFLAEDSTLANTDFYFPLESSPTPEGFLYTSQWTALKCLWDEPFSVPLDLFRGSVLHTKLTLWEVNLSLLIGFYFPNIIEIKKEITRDRNK